MKLRLSGKTAYYIKSLLAYTRLLESDGYACSRSPGGKPAHCLRLPSEENSKMIPQERHPGSRSSNSESFINVRVLWIT